MFAVCLVLFFARFYRCIRGDAELCANILVHRLRCKMDGNCAFYEESMKIGIPTHFDALKTIGYRPQL